MENVIQVQSVRKDYRFWMERPTSLKTMLVDVLKGKAKLGKKVFFNVFDDVSFDIKKGEFVGIMGRNGAGKSTLLKLLCGIYVPNSGKIEVRERIAPLIELGAGFHPDLSGYENIFLNAAVLGFERKATNNVIQNVIDFSELGDKIYMPVKNYSSGMLIRLGFSIATHLPAPILLIDEVLAVGDAGFQRKCLQKIHELHKKEGRTIILVTHAVEDVQAHCQRCIVIADKKKIYDGPPKEGIGHYMKSVNRENTL